MFSVSTSSNIYLGQKLILEMFPLRLVRSFFNEFLFLAKKTFKISEMK